MKAAVALGVCFLAAGCSDGDPPKPAPVFSSEQTCGMRVQISGSVTAALAGRADEVTCGQTLPGSRLRMAFRPAEGELMELSLSVDDLQKGATGNAFAATLLVGSREPENWTEHFCAVNVAEQSFLGQGQRLGQPYGEAFRVLGSGHCTPAAGSEHVTVGPFDFVTAITW
jgi:hypothetical protein